MCSKCLFGWLKAGNKCKTRIEASEFLIPVVDFTPVLLLAKLCKCYWGTGQQLVMYRAYFCKCWQWLYEILHVVFIWSSYSKKMPVCVSENDDFELYSYILFNNINTVFKYLYKFCSYPLWKTLYNMMSDYVLAFKFLDATSPPITRHSHY